MSPVRLLLPLRTATAALAAAVGAMSRTHARLLVLLVALALCVAPEGPAAGAERLPGALDDRQFWDLIDRFSERSGFFNSDNLVSNEETYQHVIPELRRRVRPGTAYIGVGPDQNFTYIAALEPGIAFIVDVRRGNLLVHLLYKAIVELSDDRAEFVSRLFSRPRPEGLATDASVSALFRAFGAVEGVPSLYHANLAAVVAHLTETRRLPLSRADLSGIEYVYSQFFAGGPSMTFVSHGSSRPRYPSFEQLQIATDRAGVAHGYLASEAAFGRLRMMHRQNLIVPIVGNFAGARALASVAEYLQEHGATVGTFYTSNVEQYLFQDRIWPSFAANLARLPIDEASTLVRSCFTSCADRDRSRSVMLFEPLTVLLRDAAEGRIQSYWELLSPSRVPAFP